ncbi:MAG: hypothetical protein Q4G22_02030 [Paracoccus sp. (in: a-proteobacteria)]|uniref:hypothetical protein n=1 Tax=Paracoccus sp. TaxID=267 RepID=UPI0026DF76AA|nr:hypothetical protein [Paracoccus sp. (in: a-proteobacteria)]MDO5630595.1 hypothetical protein [Paracoccus sp. (in: a-proteobacteria)]
MPTIAQYQVFRAYLLETVKRLLTPEMSLLRTDSSSYRQIIFDAPATQAEITAVEDEIGTAMPQELQNFFLYVSKEIVIRWGLPSRPANLADEWGRRIYPEEPPEAFMQWAYAPGPDGDPGPDNYKSPEIEGAALVLALSGPSGVAAAFRHRESWRDFYDPERAANNVERDHFQQILDFYDAGFPFAIAPNGDLLAIDMRDGADHLMHLSHEGEVAGIELDTRLAQLMAHQAILGFVGFDFPVLQRFNARPVAEQDDVIELVSFRSDTADGQLWADWFWLGNPPGWPEALSKDQQ